MNKSESIKELAIALNKAQGEMQKAHKRSDNPFFNSTYANLSEVIDCVKEAFTANGLSFTQMPSFDGGIACVETMIMHVSGEWISSVAGSPLSKQNPQGIGDATTYLRRYSLAAVAGLGQEDDDGNSNSSSEAKKQQGNDKPVNWYNTFDNDKQAMIEALRNGETNDGIIKSLQAQGYAINKKVRQQIMELK